jgi:Bacterial SH3 domain
MALQRYFSAILVPGVLVGLLACAQPPEISQGISQGSESSVAPAAVESPTTPAAPARAKRSAESSPSLPKSSDRETLQKNRNFTACMEAVAYDPTDTTVNLRDQPDGTVLANLPNLTRLQAPGPAGAEPGWNEVFVVESETWGFVWGDKIYRTYYQVQDPQDTSANVRRSPNGEVITSVPNGTEVRFLGIEGSWTQVQLDNGETGYISTQLLSDPSCFQEVSELRFPWKALPSRRITEASQRCGNKIP